MVEDNSPVQSGELVDLEIQTDETVDYTPESTIDDTDDLPF